MYLIKKKKKTFEHWPNREWDQTNIDRKLDSTFPALHQCDPLLIGEALHHT